MSYDAGGPRGRGSAVPGEDRCRTGTGNAYLHVGDTPTLVIQRLQALSGEIDRQLAAMMGEGVAELVGRVQNGVCVEAEAKGIDLHRAAARPVGVARIFAGIGLGGAFAPLRIDRVVKCRVE